MHVQPVLLYSESMKYFLKVLINNKIHYFVPSEVASGVEIDEDILSLPLLMMINIISRLLRIENISMVLTTILNRGKRLKLLIAGTL